MSETLELLRLAPVAMVVLNRIGRVTDFNVETGNLLRRQVAQVRDSLFTTFLTVESIPDFLKHLWDSFEYPDVTHICPLELLRGDGSRKSAILKSRLASKAEGPAECCSILVEARDERALECELGRELFSRIELGIVWLDAEERIVDCNAAVAGLWDFQPSQLQECPIGSLFFDWSSESALASALSGQHFRLHAARRDGHLIPIEANLLQTHGDLGEAVYLLTTRDLRAQELMERRSLKMAELERRAVGRDLHDALGQNLIGMAFLADELAAALASAELESGDSATPLGERAQRLAGLCRETNAIARNLVRGLVPVGLEQGGGGLPAALRDLASSCSTTHGIVCQAHCQECEVDTETAEQLFRIAQEAVTNALKHSGCSRIDLELIVKQERIALTVTDDGKGIAPGESQHFGTGLHSMRHRCNLIGARMAVGRLPGGGTSLSVSLAASRQPHRPGSQASDASPSPT